MDDEKPRAGTRRRKPTDVRRAEIVEAAMRILATDGARKLTARSVAAEVGMTVAAIYRHFGGMEEILDAVVERVEDILFDGFPPEGADALERLGRFFAMRVHAIVTHADVSPILLSSGLAEAAGSARAERFRSFRTRSRSFVEGCLREADARGLLAEGTDFEAASVVVLGAILALGHVRTHERTRSGAEKLAADVWRHLESTLRRPGGTVTTPRG